jgi:hypothetical protein
MTKRCGLFGSVIVRAGCTRRTRAFRSAANCDSSQASSQRQDLADRSDQHPTEDEATRAAQFAQEKLKAEKARKKRLSLERVKAHEVPGSRQQDQMYYGYAALDALQRRDRRPAAFPPMVR